MLKASINKYKRIALICALGLIILAAQVLLFYALWSKTAAMVCAAIELPILAGMCYEIARAPIIEDEER